MSVAEFSPLAAWRRRYRTAPHGEPTPWNRTLEVLFDHRSVRRFLPEPIGEATLATLIAAAQSAPTSSNLQSWSVVEVADPTSRTLLAEWAGGQRHVAEAPLFLVFLADLSRAARVTRAAGAEPVTLDHVEALVTAVADAALASQNTVVAAESLGLGTVYIGALRNRIEEVARLLELPPLVLPLFGLAIGRPDPAVATDVKPRLPQEVVLHRERYAPPPGEADAIADYDRRLRDFQNEQGLPPQDWSTQLTRRVSEASALSGRGGLRAALDRFGLALR